MRDSSNTNLRDTCRDSCRAAEQIKRFDTLILGGGMAGLAAAVSANRSGKHVALLEKNNALGRKLLMAGSGQCNVTHAGEIETFFAHYGGSERFVAPALRQFPPSTLIDFLNQHGVATIEREDGKIFPASMNGHDVLNALISAARNNGCEIFLNTPVDSVLASQKILSVLSGERVFCADTVILAAGGRSVPATGSTGDGYRIAEQLGHTVVEPREALVPLESNPWPYRDCAGISLVSKKFEIFTADTKPKTLPPQVACVNLGAFWPHNGKTQVKSVHRAGKKIYTGKGAILWTHRGLSGPAILDASRYVRPGDRLLVALTVFEERERLEQELLSAAANRPKKSVAAIFAQMGVPERLVRAIFREQRFDPELAIGALTRPQRRRLVELFSSWPFDVTRTGGWSTAMTTAGGVALAQVNRLTMESRIVPGLFFAGETLDVDGDCGGYNLQWAWSSGSLAGAFVFQTATPAGHDGDDYPA